MPRPAHLRADDRQLASIRNELHTLIDKLMDAWPDLEHQARTMGRGYPSASLAAAGTGATIDVDGDHVPVTAVERLALTNQPDPALRAAEALDAIDELRRTARRLTGTIAGLLPRAVTDTHLDTDADNRVARCADCGEWVLRGDLRRIDNQPYHATSCFFRVWRRQRSA